MKNWRSNKASFIEFIKLAERVAKKHDPDIWKLKLDSYSELLIATIETTEYLESLISNGVIKHSGELNITKIIIRQNKTVIESATQ